MSDNEWYLVVVIVAVFIFGIIRDFELKAEIKALNKYVDDCNRVTLAAIRRITQ